MVTFWELSLIHEANQICTIIRVERTRASVKNIFLIPLASFCMRFSKFHRNWINFHSFPGSRFHEEYFKAYQFYINMQIN